MKTNLTNEATIDFLEDHIKDDLVKHLHRLVGENLIIMPKHSIKFTNEQLFKFGIISHNLTTQKTITHPTYDTPKFIKNWTKKVTNNFIDKNLSTYEMI